MKKLGRFEGLPPLFWPLIAFLLIVLVRAGTQAFEGFGAVLNPRTFNVLEAAIVVGSVRLWALFRAAPWEGEDTRGRKVWRASLLLALMPLLLFVLEGVTVQRAKIAEAPTAADAANLAINAVVSALGLGAPAIALWLAVGLQLKSPARSFVAWAAKGVWLLVRELGPLCLVISGYAWMEAVIGQPAHTSDAQLAAADAVLFSGHDPIALLQPIISRPLSEWMAFSYSFYAFLFPIAVGGVFYARGVPGLQEISFAAGTALLIGYASYMIVPAIGPMYTQVYEVPLDLYWTKGVKEALMDRLRISWDCFPSMHTCAALVLSFVCWRRARGVFWATLPMVVTIPLACVYLRYHYVVDVLAGLVLFGAIALLTSWRFPKASQQPSQPPPPPAPA